MLDKADFLFSFGFKQHLFVWRISKDDSEGHYFATQQACLAGHTDVIQAMIEIVEASSELVEDGDTVNTQSCAEFKPCGRSSS